MQQHSLTLKPSPQSTEPSLQKPCVSSFCIAKIPLHVWTMTFGRKTSRADGERPKWIFASGPHISHSALTSAKHAHPQLREEWAPWLPRGKGWIWNSISDHPAAFERYETASGERST